MHSVQIKNGLSGTATCPFIMSEQNPRNIKLHHQYMHEVTNNHYDKLEVLGIGKALALSNIHAVSTDYMISIDRRNCLQCSTEQEACLLFCRKILIFPSPDNRQQTEHGLPPAPCPA